jgi:uncharacterized protein (DUF952 family)
VEPVLHLIAAADYAARAEQPVVVVCPPGGFIHLSQGAALLTQVANSFMRSAPGAFLVLEVDPEVLGAALRWEPPDPPAAPGSPMEGALFPHLYADLPRTAIVSVRAAVRAADGTFLST